MHPHVPVSDDDRNAATIAAQRNLIRSLETRLRAQRRRIEQLEFVMGWEKRALLDEVERLRRALRGTTSSG